MTSNREVICSHFGPGNVRAKWGVGLLLLGGWTLLSSGSPVEAAVANISNGACVTSDVVVTATTLWSCSVRSSNGGAATVTNVKSTVSGAPDEAALGTSLSTRIGSKALLIGDMTTTASEADSVAIGNNARVTAIGAVNDTSGIAGQRGVAIGLNASTTMASSIAVGYGAIVQNTPASTRAPTSAIAIGTAAAAMGNRSIAIGSQAGSTNSNGFDNVVVGIASGQNTQPVMAANNAGVVVNASNNAAFGVNTGNNVTGGSNSAFGAGAGNNVGANTDSTKSNCLFSPYYCYGGGGNGTNNVALGNGAGNSVYGALNAGIGWRAGTAVNGFNNTGIGPLAGFTVTGSGNVGIGSFGGAYVTGRKNTAVGNSAGANVKGDANTAIGDGAGGYVNGTGNLAMGQDAGAGSSSTALTVDRSTAIGQRAIAYGNDALALGTNAVAGVSGQNSNVVNSIAIGNGSISAGIGSVALGAGTQAATGSVAIGDGATATGLRSVSIGYGNIVSGDGSGAFGDPNIVTGSGSYALGNNNAVNANNTFVVGNNVTVPAGLDGAVVLGNNSTVSSAVSVPSGVINGTTYTYAGGTPAAGDVVSVGSDSAPRQIQNVAAGRVTSTSTDAVNGSQLFATNQAIENVGVGMNSLGTSVASVFGGASTYDPITNRVTAGFTIGGVSYGSVQDALRVVNTSATAGWNLRTNGDTPSNVGAGGNVQFLNGQNIAIMRSGTDITIATNPNLIADSLTLSSGQILNATGLNMNGTKVTNLTAGAVTATSTDAINGSQLYSTNQMITTLGKAAVRYKLDATGEKTNTVELVGGDPNVPVLISNVAAGVARTDAVNVGQLDDGIQRTAADSRAYADNRAIWAVEQSNAYTDQAATRTLKQANDYTDYKFGQLNGEIADVRGEARQAAAIGLAAASLRYDDRPGKVSVSVGGGYWRGRGATAFGAGYTSENGRVRANLSGTTADGKWGVGAGLSFTLN